MADEYAKPPYNRQLPNSTAIQLAKPYTIKRCMEVHYTNTLRELGKEKGMLGQIIV
jgi:type I restriction enzyme M protein